MHSVYFSQSGSYLSTLSLLLLLCRNVFHWNDVLDGPSTSPHHQFKRNKSKKINTTEKHMQRKATNKLFLALYYAKRLSTLTSDISAMPLVKAAHSGSLWHLQTGRHRSLKQLSCLCAQGCWCGQCPGGTETHSFRKSLAVRAGERGWKEGLPERSSTSLRQLEFEGQNSKWQLLKRKVERPWRTWMDPVLGEP